LSNTRTMTLYMCGVDWDHELGEAADGTRLYPSLASLKKHAKCSDQCGVIEVTVEFSNIKWVVPQNLDLGGTP